jgi:hypothetical protein
LRQPRHDRAIPYHHRRHAYYGDEVAVAPRFDPDDTKAVLGVLVRNALNQSSQHLSIGWMGCVFMMAPLGTQ